MAVASPRRHLKFEGVEAGRAIAAIFVVIYHAGNNLAEPRFFGTRIFDGRLANLNLGIDFFFVLSGFIIAWVHWGDLGQPGRLANYAKRRFTRIYPPYWGILIPLAVLYMLTPGTGKAWQHDPANLFFSFTLLPYTTQPILGAAWTLVYEVMFYVVFGLIILIGRGGRWLLVGWAVAIVLAQFAAPLPYPISFPLSLLNLEFLLGIVTALTLRRRAVPFAGSLTLVALAVFLGVMVLAPQIQEREVLTRLCFGLSSAAMILGLVELERAGRLHVPRWLAFLGSASYSIYLIHGFVMSMVIQGLFRMGGHSLPPPVVLLVMVTGGVVAGCLYHVAVERPLLRGLRRFFDARATGRAVQPAVPSRSVSGESTPLR